MLKTVAFLLLVFLAGQYLQYSIVDATETSSNENYHLFESKNVSIHVDIFDDKAGYNVLFFGRVIQKVRFSFREFSADPTKDGFTVRGQGQNIEFKIEENGPDFVLLKVSRRTVNNEQSLCDCFELEMGHMHWFGGPQIFTQYWPVEKLKFDDYSYISKQQDNFGVAERYWLQSKGAFIYIEDNVPLFIDQNVNGDKLCFKADNRLPYNARNTEIEFDYYIGIGNNAKIAHMKAVAKFLKKPTAVPDRRMVQHPIWSTWARYKRNIDESIATEFAQQIKCHGFENSQFEIDDDWEICYGALEFRESKFKNIKTHTDYLKELGFRVTLWIHPFINKGCEPWYSEAKNKGYLVTNYDNNPDTEWWNSEKGQAAYIDFTKPEAASWYVARLAKLKRDSGVDSFKFDAGETSWSPKDPKLNATLDDHPNAITKAYLRTVAQFGPMIEVRVGQGTQDLPVFLRMLDKDTEWTFKNGLPTLITTLLQLNLVGYPFILPDMIGGNGYNTSVTKELFIRWLQANVFMPSLQFSYVPWDFDAETVEISKHFTKLHADHTDLIMEAMNNAVQTGEPVNPPIWWTDPEDKTAQAISDEFLLGNRILAAPVITKGDDYRHIYLPRGKWFDPNQNKDHIGPIWLMDYPAPLDVLPYFIRKD